VRRACFIRLKAAEVIANGLMSDEGRMMRRHQHSVVTHRARQRSASDAFTASTNSPVVRLIATRPSAPASEFFISCHFTLLGVTQPTLVVISNLKCPAKVGRSHVIDATLSATIWAVLITWG
jgi:hypothetical protein